MNSNANAVMAYITILTIMLQKKNHCNIFISIISSC